MGGLIISCYTGVAIRHRPTTPVDWSDRYRAAKLSLLNFLSLFRDLQKPTRFGGGGGSNRIFPWSPKAGIFRYLQFSCKISFLPHIHWYSSVETHIFFTYAKNKDFLLKNKRSLKLPKFRDIWSHFRETWRSGVISGNSRTFRETWQVCRYRHYGASLCDSLKKFDGEDTSLTTRWRCRVQMNILRIASILLMLYAGTKIIQHSRSLTQSFQVEGPLNREISLFIGNTIGRFFRELFQAEVYYINKT